MGLIHRLRSFGRYIYHPIWIMQFCVMLSFMMFNVAKAGGLYHRLCLDRFAGDPRVFVGFSMDLMD